ncbi:MAG TPA: hypothetical protein VK466_02185 [Terriglobales bacterium]|nr:hypothetical protein [Terriglobales bacterium]
MKAEKTIPTTITHPTGARLRNGYKGWMGPVNAFQNGYQQGYADGFRSGFLAERPGWRDGEDRYRGGAYYSNGYYSGNYVDSGRIAYDTGYQDGVTMAREDLYKNKRFNPNPRARFDDRDHGYHREYGDKNAYKARYTDGYRSGYETTFNRRY